MADLVTINGLNIKKNQISNRNIDIEFKDELIDKLILPLNKWGS